MRNNDQFARSKAAPRHHLYVYRPDGTFQREVQNDGGSRNGGTVMDFLPYDSGHMISVSNYGATASANHAVPTMKSRPLAKFGDCSGRCPVALG